MKTFILNTDICNGILGMLSNEQSGMLFKLIVGYVSDPTQFEGIKPTDDAEVYMAFAFFRAGLDANMKSYKELCEKRRESGRKGAEVTNGKLRQKRQESANAENNGKSQQKSAKSANCDKNGKIGYNENKDTNVSYDILYNNKKNFTNVKSQKETHVSFSPDFDIKKFISFFNTELDRVNSTIPRLKFIKGARLKSLNARVRENSKEDLVEVVRKAAVSDFLNGKNDRSFIATFDWLIKPNNFPKVLEGNYDNKKPIVNETTETTIGSLIMNYQKEQQEREQEKERHIRSIYAAAQDGDERSVMVVEEWRKNGILAKYNLK